MKNKLFASVIALICIVALLCACSVELPLSGGKEPAASGEEKTFTIQVVHADGTMMEKKLTTQQTYLANALFDAGLLTEKDALETGMYTIVDGEEASWAKDQAYWGFYVDGQYAVEGMNTTEIRDGAVYKLEYTVG